MTGIAEQSRGPADNDARWPRIVLGLALIVLAAVAIYVDFHRDLWLDEAYTLDTIRRPLGDTFRQSVRFELQPPLYFILLNLWIRISPTIEWARLFSTLALALTLWVLYRLAKLLELARSSFSLPLVAALSPMLLWAASEARCYALAALLTTVTTYFFVGIWVAGTARSRRDLVLYVACAYLSLMTFYYAAFLLAAQLLAGLLLAERRRALLLCFLALGVLLLPWAPTLLAQTTADSNFQQPAVVSSAAWLVGWVLSALRECVFAGAPVVLRGGATPALGVLLAAVIGLRIGRGRTRWSKAEMVFGVLWAVPFAVLAGARLTHALLVDSRHYIVVTTSLIVFIGLLVARMPSPVARPILGLLLTAVLALSAVSYLRNADGQEAWKPAVAYVTARAGPTEPILFAEADAVLPFRYYYRGSAPLLGLPRDHVLDSYALADMRIRDDGQLRRRFAADVGPSRTFWLVERSRPDALGGAILDRFIRDEMVVLDMRDFPGVRVLHGRTPAVLR